MWPLILKPLRMRFKLHGTYNQRQLIQDLQDTVKELNLRLAETEAALNDLKAQVDAL